MHHSHIYFLSALNTPVNQQMNNEVVSKADRWTVAGLVFQSVSGESAETVCVCGSCDCVCFSLLSVSGDPVLSAQPAHAHEVHGPAQVTLTNTHSVRIKLLFCCCTTVTWLPICRCHIDSVVKRLIVNKIKVLFTYYMYVYNTCVCTVYIMYIKTHTHTYFENIYMCIYIYILILYINIFNI